jgi:hypothetical protein
MKELLREVTLWDKLLISFLIAASIITTILTTTAGKIVGQKDIVVKVDNMVVKKVPVNKDTDNKTYSFDFNGNTGYIEVKNGAVRMLEMPEDICPEGVCSDTGWISKKYQVIVCLPNNITVSVEENNIDNQDNIDVIVS